MRGRPIFNVASAAGQAAAAWLWVYRDMNKLDNAKDARATDALLNYETVKYFSNDELERRQFESAITAYQAVEFKALASLNILNVIQSSVIFVGVISGLIVCTNVGPFTLICVFS